MSVGGRLSDPALAREQVTSQDLGQHEQDHEPAPDKKVELDVVPHSNKGEDSDVAQDGLRDAPFALRTRAAERDVDVAEQPTVIAAVPAAPEGHG